MKPMSGNDCNTCPKKFDCFTSRMPTACPILCGEDVERVYPLMYCNIAVTTKDLGRYDGYRIKPEQLIKLVRKAKFKVKRKYGCNYLEVIE